MQLRKLTVKDVTVTVRCEEEDSGPRSHLFTGEDEEVDEEACSEIEQRLNRGDLWAWCCAVIEVSFGPFKEVATLGCCSYDNEEDFRNNSGYFDDMMKEAIEQLNEGVSKLFSELLPLVEIDTSAT